MLLITGYLSEARKLIRLSARYIMVANKSFIGGALHFYVEMFGKRGGGSSIKGSTRRHLRKTYRMKSIGELLRIGYYWPEMLRYRVDFVNQCDKGQRFPNFIHTPAEILH